MINSTFAPHSLVEMTSDKLRISSQGVKGTVAAGGTATLSLALADDYMLTGVRVIAKGMSWGDNATIQITDSVNGNSTIVSNWVIRDDFQEVGHITMPYPVKIAGGSTINATYKNTAILATVSVAVNYDLHLILM